MKLFILAQSQSSIGPFTALLLAGLLLTIGLLIGYAAGYRFKRKYLAAARQLANLRGENFRGELTTIGATSLNRGQTQVAQTNAPSAHDSAGGPNQACTRCERYQDEARSLATDCASLQQTIDDYQQQLAQLQHDQRQAEQQRLVDREEIESLKAQRVPSAASDTGQAWQIEQLHREHIEMQMKMDEYVAQIAQLTSRLEDSSKP